METRRYSDNFKLLASVVPPLTMPERVKFVISFRWKSVRNFSAHLNISHSGLNACLKHPEKYPGVHKKLVDALGFDPWDIKKQSS
jgi:hypothetical protein